MIKLKPTAIMQYILIYIMLIVPGSSLFAIYLKSNAKYYILLTIFGILFLFHKKYRENYGILLSGFLLLVTIILRITVGGVGIDAWLRLVVCILSTQFAICCDQENFFDRWIRLVSFFAVISIVFWGLFFIFPNLVDIWPAISYKTQDLGTGEWAVEWHGKGLLLYSFLEIHASRNCGIYTEPGVYQVVLNSALFILLFCKDKLHLKNFRQYRFYISIIFIALISCQSTTGYIGLLLNIFFFYITRQKQTTMLNRIKRYFLIVLMIGLGVLMVDYASNGTESILYEQFIYKLFGESGGIIDISAGTGQYRLGTIIVSLTSILENPFGIGYDAFNAIKKNYAEGLVAASFVTFAAIYGVIPWLVIIFSIFKPVIKKIKRSNALLFILLFINTTLAQTDLLYPSLIMIPMYLQVSSRKASVRRKTDLYINRIEDEG